MKVTHFSVQEDDNIEHSNDNNYVIIIGQTSHDE